MFLSVWEKLPERERKAYERLSIRFSDGSWPRFVHKRRGCEIAPLPTSEFESGEQPTRLLAASYSDTMVQMASLMKALPPPAFPDGTPSVQYNFTIASHADKHLA